MPPTPPDDGTGRSAGASRDELPSSQQFFSLFTAVMLPMFLAAIDQTLLVTATPRIAADLGGLSDTSWVGVGYLLAATVAAPLYGRLGDRLGRRNVLMAALGVFALGSLACAVAPTMGLLIAARVVQGLGGGGLMVLSQALIGELVPPRHRPRYQSRFAVVFAASSVGGPVLGGFVVHHASWRWLFWANLPLVALALWRVSRLPRPGRSPHRDAPVDPWGLLLFVVTAVCTLLWFGLVGHRFRLLSAQSAALAAGAVVGALVLWAQQRRHVNAFLPLDLTRRAGVGWVCATVIGFAATMFGLLFVLPIYLQLVRGATASDAGLQLLPLTVGILVGSTLNSRWTLRSGVVGGLAPVGLGAVALASGVLAWGPPGVLPTLLAAGAAGIGLGTVMPNAQLTVQLIAGRERLGAASALLSLARSLGASFGTAAFGGLSFVLLGAGTLPSEGGVLQTTSIDTAHAARAFHQVFAAIAVFAAVTAWAAARTPRPHLGAEEKAPAEEALGAAE